MGIETMADRLKQYSKNKKQAYDSKQEVGLFLARVTGGKYSKYTRFYEFSSKKISFHVGGIISFKEMAQINAVLEPSNTYLTCDNNPGSSSWMIMHLEFD